MLSVLTAAGCKVEESPVGLAGGLLTNDVIVDNAAGGSGANVQSIEH